MGGLSTMEVLLPETGTRRRSADGGQSGKGCRPGQPPGTARTWPVEEGTGEAIGGRSVRGRVGPGLVPVGRGGPEPAAMGPRPNAGTTRNASAPRPQADGTARARHSHGPAVPIEYRKRPEDAGIDTQLRAGRRPLGTKGKPACRSDTVKCRDNARDMRGGHRLAAGETGQPERCVRGMPCLASGRSSQDLLQTLGELILRRQKPLHIPEAVLPGLQGPLCTPGKPFRHSQELLRHPE